MAKTLSAIIGTAAILASCTTSQPQRMTTNTMSVSAGRENYTFDSVKIDLVNSWHDNYAVVPKDPDTKVIINRDGKKYTANVLEARMIPFSNSTINRTENDLQITANESSGYLVNHFYDSNGKLQQNPEGEPIPSFFVVERRQFPQTVTSDELNLIETRIFEKVVKQPGYIEFNGVKLIPLYDLDIDGRESKVFIDAATISSRSLEKRTELDDGTVKVEAKFGFEGVGYYIVDGEEIKLPSQKDLEEQGYRQIRVLEGESSMYISVPESLRQLPR